MDGIRDERLAAVARGDDVLAIGEAGDVAAELLRLRRMNRSDSRRAMQIRRLRWQAELVAIRVESLLERLPATALESVALSSIIGKLCARADELVGLTRALPLELGDIDVAAAIAKWLRSSTTDASVLPDLKGSELTELADSIERGDWKEVHRG